MSKNEYGRIRRVGSERHPNGYWDKITYWSGILNEAILSKNLRGVDTAHRKLDYFIGREWDNNPTMTMSGES